MSKQRSFGSILALSGAFFLSALCGSATQAQSALNSIEVLVNDEPISSHDINERLRLVIAVSGGVSDEEELRKVREQVIRTMIDERLQIQEAAEIAELIIPDTELDQYFARQAEDFGQSPEQLAETLRQIGSSKRSMQTQLNAEVVWSQLVRGRFGTAANVSDEEVESFIQRLHDNKGKFEYRLSEIVLLVDDPVKEAEVRRNAEILVGRIREGADFSDIAQQLSASSSAAVGGDLGWIQADTLSDVQQDIIKAVDIGRVSDPIRTPGGYLILAPKDRRRTMVADPLDTQLQVKQFFISKDTMVADASAEAHFRAMIEPLHETGLACDHAEEMAEKAGSEGKIDVGIMRLRGLTPDVREHAEHMEPGEATPIMVMSDGLRSLLICDRREATVTEPEYDDVEEQLRQQRLSMIARRYLRDIRRDAIIDYR